MHTPRASADGLKSPLANVVAVVFDWDGTLMDSTAAITRSLRAACTDIGLADPGNRIAAYVIGLGLQDALRHVAPTADHQQVQALIERYRHHYLGADHRLRLFDDAEPLLQCLQTVGMTMAVATGKSRAGLDRALAQTSIGHYFAATRCADESESKPSPQMLHDLAESLQLPVDQFLVVGDTHHDLWMAHHAGAKAVAVTTGAHSEEQLMEAKPLACFESLRALQDWLISNHQKG